MGFQTSDSQIELESLMKTFTLPKRTTKVTYSIGRWDKTLSPQTSFRTNAPTSLKPLCNAMYKKTIIEESCDLGSFGSP